MRPVSLSLQLVFSLFQEPCINPSDCVVLCAVDQSIASAEISLDADRIAGIELADLVGCVIGCCAAQCQVTIRNNDCLCLADAVVAHVLCRLVPVVIEIILC